jgi:hypothetical protein
MKLWGELEEESWYYAGQLEGEDPAAPVVKDQIAATLARYRRLVIRSDDGRRVLDRQARP